MKTKWVGPQRKGERVETTFEERLAQSQRRERTYRSVDQFLKHFRERKLMEHFLLDEGVFMELCSMVQADPELAK